VPSFLTRAVLVGVLLLSGRGALAEEAKPAPKTVAEIQAAHDRALIGDLAAYLDRNPRADDADQAYMAVFDKTIEHDWFAGQEPLAQRYLTQRPDGPVRSLAQIVATMARAQAGDFDAAFTRYRDLLAGLGKPEQEKFAAEFADSLASSATAAGAYPVARKVYQELLDRYGESAELRMKIQGELLRLDKVGKPAPAFVARDLSGKRIALDSYRGKYVLLDFWATWCAPCVAEVPRLQAAYARYHDAGLEILGVSLDDTGAAVADFVKARKISWPQIHGGDAGSDLVAAFGVTTIPATFLIDPEGKIVRLELRGAALDQALSKLIKPSAP
jgi:peroxiredoxin